MSAIAGIVMLDGSAVSDETIKKMLASLQSCGPDSQHFIQSGNVAFAQASLATTPEALCERQPWTDKNTGSIVVTDSRLDNREALASALGLTDKAIDDIGDAELIFASHQKWGEACAEKLLGDFTFAIWNRVNDYLFCARDQLGIRPLYYHYVAKRIFAFATTSTALQLVLAKPAALDEGRLTDALTDHLEAHDHCSTFFRDLKRLLPAHQLHLNLNAAPELRSYWQPLQNPPSPFPTTQQEWLDQLETLFIESVHCRLRSCVPLASMLSGGLDSSSVVAVASQKLQQDAKPVLTTFSAVSTEDNCSETKAIRLMQSAFILDSIEIDPEKSPAMLKAISAKWQALEEPFEASATLVHAMYRAAADRNARIMLDGVAGDTLLTEGDYLRELARKGLWRVIWREAKASKVFWGPDESLPRFLRPLISEFLIPKSLRQIVRNISGKFRSAKTPQQTIVSDEFARQINLDSRYRTLEINTGGKKQEDSSGHRAYCSIGNSVLGVERYHRLASLYSIEPRHPFLDRRLVEFCAWLPLELRLCNGYPKWALRHVMRSQLPEQIAWRKGKDHLGWLFNKNLFAEAGNSLSKDSLHPWLIEAVSASVQTRYTQLNKVPRGLAVNENDIEALLSLSAVNIWLNEADKRDKSRL